MLFRSVHKVQEAVRKAFRIAMSDPYGPVHLDASRDILIEQIEEDDWTPSSYRATSRAACAASDLDTCAALIEQAQRPIFLVGGGVLDDGSTDRMLQLAEATGIPAATLQYHPDAFPTSHPLALGPLGRNGWSSANRAMPQADLIIAVGAHLDIFSTQFRYGIISRDARIIHHSHSASDVGVVFPVTQGVIGSSSSFIDRKSTRLNSSHT